jgi:hypothetical protein
MSTSCFPRRSPPQVYHFRLVLQSASAVPPHWIEGRSSLPSSRPGWIAGRGQPASTSAAPPPATTRGGRGASWADLSVGVGNTLLPRGTCRPDPPQPEARRDLAEIGERWAEVRERWAGGPVRPARRREGRPTGPHTLQSVRGGWRRLLLPGSPIADFSQRYRAPVAAGERRRPGSPRDKQEALLGIGCLDSLAF